MPQRNTLAQARGNDSRTPCNAGFSVSPRVWAYACTVTGRRSEPMRLIDALRVPAGDVTDEAVYRDRRRVHGQSDRNGHGGLLRQSQRRRVNQPEMPLHKLRKRFLGAFPRIATQQFGIVGHRCSSDKHRRAKNRTKDFSNQKTDGFEQKVTEETKSGGERSGRAQHPSLPVILRSGTPDGLAPPFRTSE